jgi:hypothetical protein
MSFRGRLIGMGKVYLDTESIETPLARSFGV